MNIQMLGIDHSKASVEYRELFSFTRKGTAAALEQISQVPGVTGCVILSTCNRMEIYVSCQEEKKIPLYELLCQIKEVEAEQYRSFFVTRDGMDAVNHLFWLACGLKSKILGEDQIITQVKDSLTFARENYCTDHVLEVLFRMAVTAAKKVKTNVPLVKANHTVIEKALQVVTGGSFELEDKVCMVIGNGEMGKLAAVSLLNAGAAVTVTIRQYRSGIVQVMPGCGRINYGDRLSFLPKCDLIVSATASPNYTLRYDEVAGAYNGRNLTIIDLAVPRDVEQSVGGIDGIDLYDIDDFDVDLEDEEKTRRIGEARQILAEQIQQFVTWYECRDLIPSIQRISEQAAADAFLRMGKTVKQITQNEKQEQELKEAASRAVKKSVDKLIFALRDGIERDRFRECVEVLTDLYHEEA